MAHASETPRMNAKVHSSRQLGLCSSGAQAWAAGEDPGENPGTLPAVDSLAECGLMEEAEAAPNLEGRLCWLFVKG